MAFGEKNYVVKENDHELDWQEKQFNYKTIN